MEKSRLHTQALIIGSGIAGATAALLLSESGVETTLISSGPSLDTGNTKLAQGGIVYKATEKDPRQLERDILRAGWDHNFKRAVRHLAMNGPTAVKDILIDRLNIPFVHQTECDEFELRMEGGHDKHRILHCADFTGKAIMDGLMAAVHDAPNIRILTDRTAVDLLTTHHHSGSMDYKYQLANQCVGAYVFNDQSGEVETILSDFTVLATGGLGQIFLHTTNSASSIGSALPMAFRAGARLMNCEYIQFHPTALFHRAERRFLITEAMRGDGARLVNARGETFVRKYDPRGDLAPRDIVTRAIMEEMLRTGADFVYLDAANFMDAPSGHLETHFPTIFKKCLEIGIDIRRDPIPVVPAAHYSCGGVLADTTGKTSLDRLYAIGECSCTGVHGANRLASTSLLEGLLWGQSAAQDIRRKCNKRSGLALRLRDSIPDWVSPGQADNEDPALIAQDWATIRNTMWNYVGITRTRQRLARAVDDMRRLYKHLSDFYKRTPPSKALVDLFHGCQSAYSVTLSAMRNTKSLGCHYRVD